MDVVFNLIQSLLPLIQDIPVLGSFIYAVLGYVLAKFGDPGIEFEYVKFIKTLTIGMILWGLSILFNVSMLQAENLTVFFVVNYYIDNFINKYLERKALNV